MSYQRRITEEEFSRLAEEFSNCLKLAFESKLRRSGGAVRHYSDARTIYGSLSESLETGRLSIHYRVSLDSMKLLLDLTYKRIEQISSMQQPLDTLRRLPT